METLQVSLYALAFKHRRQHGRIDNQGQQCPTNGNAQLDWEATISCPKVFYPRTDPNQTGRKGCHFTGSCSSKVHTHTTEQYRNVSRFLSHQTRASLVKLQPGDVTLSDCSKFIFIIGLQSLPSRIKNCGANTGTHGS